VVHKIGSRTSIRNCLIGKSTSFLTSNNRAKIVTIIKQIDIIRTEYGGAFKNNANNESGKFIKHMTPIIIASVLFFPVACITVDK
jgi:hypothetical protein